MAVSMAHVLVIAGSDSSGGAGIARDVETLAAFGVKACLAITAVTVQTHTAVERVQLCDPDLVEAQMRAALSANVVAAIKIGMLGSRETVARVAAVLRDHCGDTGGARSGGRIVFRAGAAFRRCHCRDAGKPDAALRPRYAQPS